MEEEKLQALIQSPSNVRWQKVIGIVIGSSALLGTVFFGFAPADRIEAAKAALRRLTNDPGQLCFDVHSDRIKDPTTAQIVESEAYSDNVYVTYRAANSFGVFGKDIFVCPLTNGRFDKHKAELAKLEAELEDLRSGNDQSDR